MEKSGGQNLKLKNDGNNCESTCQYAWFPQGICSLEIHVPFSGDSAEYFWARPQLLSAGSRESNPGMKRINTNIYIYIFINKNVNISI